MTEREEVFYKKAKKWISNNTINGDGICVTSKKQYTYPEVTGYYIPTLLRIGERDKAIAFAKHLCSIQKEDGSWFDSKNKEPYVFDSAQILKGLIAIRHILPDVDIHIIKGVDWILSNVKEDGRLTTPSQKAWGTDDSFCSELIHVYCIEPIRDAGVIYKRSDYITAANKILNYYLSNYREKILNFSLLSHFYAYVMEGLFDLGKVDLCREAMENLEKFRNRKGAIPGLNNVPWICSTGLFQLAIVWYKLGNLAKGDSLFNYACSIQNESGGWFGSYPPSSFAASKLGRKVFYRGKKSPYYFPSEEISWAVKYFFDAVYFKEKLEKQINEKNS